MIWLWPTLAVLISLGSVAISLVAWCVDDWRRDLSHNSASTSDDPKSALAAIRSDLSPAELTNHAVSVVSHLPRWRMVKLEEGGGVVTIHLVHATPILPLASDVTARISGDDGGSILRAESVSRFGQADLGQSPRNLHELLAALRAKPAK